MSMESNMSGMMPPPPVDNMVIPLRLLHLPRPR